MQNPGFNKSDLMILQPKTFCMKKPTLYYLLRLYLSDHILCHCYAAELFFSVGLVNETPLNAFYSTVPVERSEFGTEKATKLKGYCFKRIFGKCVKLTSKVCSEFLHTCFRMREARKWKQFGRKLVCLLLVCILLNLYAR